MSVEKIAHQFPGGITHDNLWAALTYLRKNKLVSCSSVEGRHGISAEQQRWAKKEYDSLLGYVSVR